MNNNLPWTEYKLATGRAQELNLLISNEINLMVENFGWPVAVRIGEQLLDDSTYYWKSTDKYWGGYVGLLKLEIVPGNEIEIL